jgi:GT2 family glycosyltransferase
VIPVRNGCDFLANQLGALSSDHPPFGFEVIVADNGSTDASVELARSFTTELNLRVIDAGQRPGQAYARNAGVRDATGTRILFLDCDDVVEHGYVGTMSAALARHDFVASKIDVRALNPGWRARTREIAQSVRAAEGPLPYAYGATLGIRRHIFEQVGGFNDSLTTAAEDIDLCWRLRKIGVELMFVPDALLHYRLPHSYRALFQQGRRYGFGQSQVNRLHRTAPSSRRRGTNQRLRLTIGAARLAAFSFDRGARGRGFFLLGRIWGSVLGSLRHRVSPYS